MNDRFRDDLDVMSLLKHSRKLNFRKKFYALAIDTSKKCINSISAPLLGYFPKKSDNYASRFIF